MTTRADILHDSQHGSFGQKMLEAISIKSLKLVGNKKFN